MLYCDFSMLCTVFWNILQITATVSGIYFFKYCRWKRRFWSLFKCYHVKCMCGNTVPSLLPSILCFIFENIVNQNHSLSKLPNSGSAQKCLFQFWIQVSFICIQEYERVRRRMKLFSGIQIILRNHRVLQITFVQKYNETVYFIWEKFLQDLK